MNRSEGLTDELIQAMFERRAERAAVGTLGEEILAATASTRQRSVLGLRLSGLRPNLASRPAWVTVAVLAALLGILLAVALSGHRQPGPLRTGLLAFVRAGDVYLANPDGSNAEVVLHQNGVGYATVAWSPTGAWLAADGEAGVTVVDTATGAATLLGGNNPVWSPDGRQLAVLAPAPASGSDLTQLQIIDISTRATVHSYPFPAIGDLAWSPDGNWIAATGGTSGAVNALARIDMRTGQWTEIDGGSGMLDSAREPAWSPDSLHIAFIRWGADGAVSCHGVPLCATDVYVAGADGSNPVRLNRVVAKADEPSWSPDGRWIAYRQVDRQAPSSGNGGSIAEVGTGIVIVRPDGTGERTIAAQGVATFAWSAASDRLRLIRTGGPGSAETIWDAPLEGVVQAVELAIGPAPDLFERTGHRFDWQPLAAERDVPPLPAVSQPAPASMMAVIAPASAAPVDPSTTWPALATVSDDGCRPMTIATGTGATHTLTNLCDAFFTIDTWRWSPTGSAFAAVRGGTLVIVGRDGTVALNVAHLSGLNSIHWSPDGTWLAATGAKTWLLRPDGSGVHEIPGEANWASDGSTLAVAAPDGNLLIGGRDGGDLHSIGAFPIQISWSSDDSRFAFIRDGNAWTAKRDGTDTRSVTSLPLGGASSVAWSPDGRWLAVGATHGLWLVQPDGAGSRWFGLGLDESILDFGWSPSARKVAVSIYTDGRAAPQKSYVDLIDSTGLPTVRLDRLTVPSWSPDSRFLAATNPQDYGHGTRDLVLMNEDGSGGRVLQGPPTLDPFVWLR